MSTCSSFLIFSQSAVVAVQKEVPGRQCSRPHPPYTAALSAVPVFVLEAGQPALPPQDDSVSPENKGAPWMSCLPFGFDLVLLEGSCMVRECGTILN